MNAKISEFILGCLPEVAAIPDHRKHILITVASFVKEKIKAGESLNILYVCTHNSRRSHLGQIWGKTAADYFGIKNVNTFSAGTEVTAFNPNAINAIKTIGFEVESDGALANPHYQVFYDSLAAPIRCFSKTYHDESIPTQNVIAIMTCTEADGNCPIIPGTDLRIALPYEDPKKFDGSSLQDQAYLERARQIAIENLFLFSHVQA
jgi:protein-tyrosine phosphatase/arsenate reductase